MSYEQHVLNDEEFDEQAEPVQSEMESGFTLPGIALYQGRLWTLQHDWEGGQVTLRAAKKEDLLPHVFEKYASALDD